MASYLKEYQKYDWSKLKLQLLLSKFRLFDFDLLYFWYPSRYRVIQYLIRKLSGMVKMDQESLVVAAFLISVMASWKLKIYYINRALSKLNCYTLYTVESKKSITLKKCLHQLNIFLIPVDITGLTTSCLNLGGAAIIFPKSGRNQKWKII